MLSLTKALEIAQTLQHPYAEKYQRDLDALTNSSTTASALTLPLPPTPIQAPTPNTGNISSQPAPRSSNSSMRPPMESPSQLEPVPDPAPNIEHDTPYTKMEKEKEKGKDDDCFKVCSLV